LKQLRRHLTFANIMSCVALFLALGGAAYAAKTATKVRTRNLANGAVTAAKLHGGAVTNPKLRNGAVTNPKLRNGAVTGVKIAPATIGSAQLADGSVRSGQLGGQVVTEAKIKNGAVSENKLGAEAVTAAKVKNEAVTAAKLSAGFYGQLVKNVSYVTKTSPGGGNAQTATAECPVGKQVVGGGARAIPGGAETAGLTESYPFQGAYGRQTGWTATVTREGADGGVISVVAYAICAEF
jgi:hypothetical protein